MRLAHHSLFILSLILFFCPFLRIAALIPTFPLSFLLPYSFFFNDTATTEIYTLSLHDALPILATMLIGLERFSSGLKRHVIQVGDHRVVYSEGGHGEPLVLHGRPQNRQREDRQPELHGDRKSTRLNSSHTVISYAVFCLQKNITDLFLAYDIDRDTCTQAVLVDQLINSSAKRLARTLLIPVRFWSQRIGDTLVTLTCRGT